MTLPIPTLLLRPEGSYDRNGPVSPTLSGAVRVVDGQHGPAWFVEEGTTNLYTRSPAPNASTGFQSSQATVTVIDTDLAPSGKALRLVKTNTGNNLLMDFSLYTLPSSGALTFSYYVWTDDPEGATTASFNLVQRYTDASTSNHSAPEIPLTATPQRISMSVTPNSGKTQQDFSVYGYFRASAGAVVYLSSIQAEQKPYATSYCDGSLGTGYTWAGTAHASASTRAQGIVALSGRSLSTAKGSAVYRYRDTGRLSGRPLLTLVGDTEELTLLEYVAGMGLYKRLKSGGATHGVTGKPYPTPNEWHTIYFEWETGRIGWAVDGGAMSWATLTTPFADTALTSLRLSQLWWGSVGINQHSEALTIFDRPLTAEERAELKALDSWEWDRFGGRTLAFASVSS